MRKFYTFLFLAAIISVANAQVFTSSFENWTAGAPDGWLGPHTSTSGILYNQITTGTQYGSSAVQLIDTNTTHVRFTTQPMQVDAGVSYEIKFWVKGQGDIRTAIYDGAYGTYNSYITVTNTWTEYSQTVTASSSSATGEFIISVRNTVAPDYIQIDSVAISTATVSTVTIHDIQYTTAPSGDSPLIGQTVSTGGIVSALKGTSGYYIQDGSGAWDGIYVYDYTNTVALGDSITFTAGVSEYYNITELSGLASFVLVNSGNPVHAPVAINTGDMATQGESYESVLVKVSNANCTDASAVWVVDDGSGPLNVVSTLYAYTPTLNTHYDVTGIGSYYNTGGTYEILPRDVNDITISSGIEDEMSNLQISVFPNPATKFFTIKTGQRIASVELSNIVGQKVKTYETGLTTYPVTGLQAGVYFVTIHLNNGQAVTQRIKISK